MSIRPGDLLYYLGTFWPTVLKIVVSVRPNEVTFIYLKLNDGAGMGGGLKCESRSSFWPSPGWDLARP